MYLVLLLVPLILWFLGTEKRYRWIYILYKTLYRDIVAGIRFTRFNRTIKQWNRNEETIPKLFQKIVKRHPKKVAFYFENESWTYQQLEDFSNKIGNYFKEEGYKKGETIALLLENRPEYVGIWLGLSKIGVITALINTNLVSGPLCHSIKVANSKAFIYGSNYGNVCNSIKKELASLKLYVFNTVDTTDTIIDGSKDLKKELEIQSDSSLEEDIALTKRRDKVIYIYTSGTTGLPKAAVISHARFMFTVIGIHDMININEQDIYYNPLPLYHSAGGMVAVGQSIMFGVPVVLRKKFSASSFWKDCKQYNCTVAQYIGEICRYVLAAHKDGENVEHNVKKMVGNGLQPQIWKQFAEVFHINQIYEFYGSTEGNTNLINIDNKTGAVGFVPRYATRVYPVTLIKCDELTKEPIRNKDGLCIRCAPGEAGILVGKINPKRSATEFTGYSDTKETNKKVVQDVFKPGDAYFNSGDILIQDEFGYFYFKDRTGDTFRWKGENVATTEIEAVVSNMIGTNELTVYGVEIPLTEGKAGMLAIADPQKTVNKDGLAKHLKHQLPSYAIPLFLRLVDSLPMTGTFKIKKIVLQNEGFNIEKVKDPLYFYDLKRCTYTPLSNDIYEGIVSGSLRL